MQHLLDFLAGPQPFTVALVSGVVAILIALIVGGLVIASREIRQWQRMTEREREEAQRDRDFP